jgi:hypothetical protein
MRAKIPSGCGGSSILNSGGFNFPAPHSGSHGTSAASGCQRFDRSSLDRLRIIAFMITALGHRNP